MVSKASENCEKSREKISTLKIFFSSPSHRIFFVLLASTSSAVEHIEANPDAKRLYDDLLSNYNRLIRPVVNNTETLTVYLGLKITQIIEVSLRNQVVLLFFVASLTFRFHAFFIQGHDHKSVGKAEMVRL